MFDIVSERYQRALADAEDEKFIMEDVTGNPVDVMDPDEAAGEASAENEVDVYSVPKKDLDKMDKLAEKLVSASDYDDEDLDELIDDNYGDDDIVVAETVGLLRDMVETFKAANEIKNESAQALTEAEDALNEINTGAFQSIKAAFSAHLKAAKTYMNMAEQHLSKGENDKAVQAYDTAIRELKAGRKEAEKIDDDGLLEHVVIMGIMTLVPVVGNIAYSVGRIYNWYNLRKQNKKGDTYSNKHKDRRKNLVLEFFLGPARAAGYSRSTVLAGYDKLIKECETMRSSIKKGATNKDDEATNEATITTPGYDPVGSYNDGIKSGTVDYDMNDCEDRGGVGVNPVIARNNQLSEAVMVSNFELTDALIDCMNEATGDKIKNAAKSIGRAINKAADWVIETLRKALTFVVGKAKQLWKAVTTKHKTIKAGKKGAGATNTGAYKGPSDADIEAARKASEAQQAKADAERQKLVDKQYLEVRIVKGIYDKGLLTAANKAGAAAEQYASGKIRQFRNSNVTAVAMDKDIQGIMNLVKAVEYDADASTVPFEEAYKMLNSVISNFENQFKAAADSLSRAAKTFKDIAKFADTYSDTRSRAASAEMDDVDSDSSAKDQEAAVQRMSSKSSQAQGWARQLRAANQALSATSSAASKVAKVGPIHLSNVAALGRVVGLRNTEAGQGAIQRAKNESAKGNLYTRAYAFVNESCIGGFQGYFDEATDTYIFGFELEEAAACGTYDEFKESLKTDGTLKVEAPNFGKVASDDLSKKDPNNSLLNKAPTLAKNTIAQAYTAEQLKKIPASDMPKVRRAVTEMIATKSGAISALKEAYNEHLFDDPSVRAAILEDAAKVRNEMDDLTNTLSIIESMTDLDTRASEIFGGIYEDSESDLSDLDLGDDKDDKKDSKKSDSKDDDDKDEKKSKKDDEECDDEECKDKDKKDDKKSDKSDDKKDDDEDEDDADEADDDNLDESALLAEIDALLSDLDA